MTTKIILDTDIGSDIDDALCLAYLLANPDCELLGITTVTGEARARAMLASALCKVAGKSVPIYPGREEPFLITQRQPHAPQAAALVRWPHETEFPAGRAVEFMRQTIRSNPHEVVLLAIGPFTNVAALFAADAEIPSLLKGLTLMGGVFTSGVAGAGPLEWNAMLDPTATAMVYQAQAPVHRSIGLDVTWNLMLKADEFRRRFRSPLLQPAVDFAEVWFQQTEEVRFHDPLAAVTIFDSQVCGFERGVVDVELSGPKVAGMTHWQADPAGRHEVALRVDSDRFFETYLSVFA